ncbi:MAG TPA: acyl-CoA desaturase [Chitinophagales bacterium]|nr:acyl-CoA desaturase [Chitinophagales bacterium]
MKVTFVNKDKTRFYSTLKQRVDEYFIQNNLSQYANGTMFFKTIFMMCLYFVPYFLIMSGILPAGMMWLFTVVMGFGLAGIGMSVMHDANHGAYSSKEKVNEIIGWSLNLVGGDANNWKIQHNIQHHTYTNIHGYDADVGDKSLMRFSPRGKYRPIQYFQVVYAFFFYSLMTFYWATGKDFVQYVQFTKARHQGGSASERFRILSFIILWKLFYYFYMLALPLLLLDVAWWQVIVGFCTLHFVAGLILSVVFQLAHVVEGTSFPEPDEKGNIENEWAIHQLHTTADFASNNRLLTFYLGGLNFQAVHHLFPRVCHVHYPKIASIVRQTATEFGVPYLYNPSLRAALASHIRHLRKLGRKAA